MQIKETPAFRETQRFRQIWIWIIILIIPAIFIYGIYKQLILGKPFGTNPASDTVLILLAIIFGLFLPVLLYAANLTTEVKRDGIYICFFPFHISFKKIKFEDLKSYQAVTYSPLKDYGGWGIRYGLKGKAYNVSGNRGVQLELKNGKKILIGSRKPEALVQTIEMLKRD